MREDNVKEILNQILKMVTDSQTEKTVPVGISNRHIHLSKEHIEKLFGQGYVLEKLKDLSQKGQYACKETVTIAGPKGSIEKVRVLGPARNDTQVEVSAGDCIKLGTKISVRISGDLKGSSGITIIGPKGSVCIEEGLIVAQRHIHMNFTDAKEFEVCDGEIVSVKTDGLRGGILQNVIVRVTEQSGLECHLDVEEANALGLTSKSRIKIVKA